MADAPQREGFFWAKWKIAASGTDTCRKCGHANSEWEKGGLDDRWEVVEVVENGGPGDDERFMVQVPGVSRWQSIEDFFWGAEVRR